MHVHSLPAQRKILNDLVAAGVYGAATYRLYATALAPTSTTPLSAFSAIQADFDGYAPQTPEGWTVGYNSAGQAQVVSDPIQFEATDGTVTDTIFGWYAEAAAVSPAAAYLLSSEAFASGIPIANAGDAVVFSHVIIFALAGGAQLF